MTNRIKSAPRNPFPDFRGALHSGGRLSGALSGGMFRAFAENGLDPVHVELGRAVVAIDAVLFLFHVRELGVAIAPHLSGEREQRVYLAFEPRVELFERTGRLSVTPRFGLGIRGLLLLVLHPFDAAEFIDQVGARAIVLRPGVVCGRLHLVESDVARLVAGRPQAGMEERAVAEDFLFQFGRVLLVIVDGPDVGPDDGAAADGVDGARRVEASRQVVDVGGEARELRVVGPPLLVHRRPRQPRGGVPVADHAFGPFGEEVAGRLHVVGIHSPAGAFAPGDVAKSVGPVIVAFLENLLMQARAVEPGGQSQFDVAAQGVVRRGGPDTVGVETLVEHQPLVIGFVVEVDFVAFDVDLAHPDIGFHGVEHLAVGGDHLVGQVVEERVFGTPEPGLFDRDDDDAAVRRPDLPRADDLAAVPKGHPERVRAFPEELRGDDQLLLVDVGRHLDACEGLGSHGLHPHRLPDACRAGVVATVRGVLQRLFAGSLFAAAQVARGEDDQTVAAARLHECGDVVGERRAASEVASNEAAVDIHLGGVVHGSEVEHHVASRPVCRNVDRTLVPDAADEVRVADARELALRGERHDDFAVESLRAGVAAFQAACAEIERVGPFAVQVDPVRPLELRAGIFRAGDLRKQTRGLKQEKEGDCGFLHGCFWLVCLFSGWLFRCDVEPVGRLRALRPGERRQHAAREQQQDVRMFHGFVYGFAVPKLRNFFGIRSGSEVNFAGEQAEDPKKIDYIRTIKTARLIGKRDSCTVGDPAPSSERRSRGRRFSTAGT